MIPLIIASLLPSLTLSLSAKEPGPEEPLNVVVVDICSARADHFGFHGYPKSTTPEMDALAKESVVFDNAIAQSSWCLPNYATLFTGHTPEVHGQYTNMPFRKLPDFEKTLAEKIKEAGYKTASFSGGIYFLKAWGLDKGFDTYVNEFSTSEAKPASVSKTMPEMLNWVRKNKKAPFFLYAAVDDLHAPYQSESPDKFDPGYQGIVHDTDTANVRFFRLYNGERLENSESLVPKLELFKSDPRHLAHLSAHYDAALNSVDKKVSDLVRRLKEMGLWEKTVVIVTADHGELLGEHGLLGHTEGLYEPLIHVPLLMHHPHYDHLKGKRISELVQRVDLTPTILDVAHVSYSDMEMQGKSLIPLLDNPDSALRTYAYASSKRNMATVTDLLMDERVIRDKRWKLHWYLYKSRFELYDLQNDPKEEHDLSIIHPDIVSQLSFELTRQMEVARPHAPGLPSGKIMPRPTELQLPTHTD